MGFDGIVVWGWGGWVLVDIPPVYGEVGKEGKKEVRKGRLGRRD